MQKKRESARKIMSRLPSQKLMPRPIYPDEVGKLYMRRRVSLTVKILPEKRREGFPSILLEGNRRISGMACGFHPCAGGRSAGLWLLLWARWARKQIF